MKFEEGSFQIDGINLIDLCKKYDSPLYVYDTNKMEEKYKKMQNAFSSVDLKINFACKALTNQAVLKFFRSLGAGLDTVSLQEVSLGIQAGYLPEDIIFTPNCVSLDEIRQAAELGVKINIDNISVLEQFGHEFGAKYPICLRINPHIMAGGNSKISVGHIDSKFGISIYQLPHVERVVETNNMKIEGLHMHTGSDILDVDVFLRGAEILFESAMRFDGLRYIDFGSGFKVPYKEGDFYTDMEQLGEELSARFKTFCDEYGNNLVMMFEPGKYLVSESGYFLANVNVIKQTTSTVFAGVNSGMNHFIRPMFYDSYHEILNISRPEGKPRLYTVVGYICETDTFGWNRKISEIQEGDILCFKNAGAYCFSMASNYNSRYKPAEVLIHKGKDHLIRRRESMEDLIRNQVEVEVF